MECPVKRRTAIVVAALLLASGYARAEPSSNVAWNADTLRLVAAGDIERGRSLAAICSACHGADGISLTPVWPNLAGQLPGYTYKQLKDYRDGKRADPGMAPMVAALSDQDMADLAALYASFAPPPVVTAAEVPALVARGDPQRIIQPCNVCHGNGGAGTMRDGPALAGQHRDYLVNALQDYKNGTRANDVYSRMRFIAAALTDDEIDALAEYFSSTAPPVF